MNSTPTILIDALRQYRHNDCSDLVAGFHYEQTVEIVEKLQKRITKLEKYNLDLANESHTKSERIAELEKAINVIDSACITWGFAFDVTNPKQSLNKLLRIETESARDPQICREAEVFALEQQANILELVRKHNVRQKRKFGSRWGSGHIIENLQIEERNLREQAKQLKGGAE